MAARRRARRGTGWSTDALQLVGAHRERDPWSGLDATCPSIAAAARAHHGRPPGRARTAGARRDAPHRVLRRRPRRPPGRDRRRRTSASPSTAVADPARRSRPSSVRRRRRCPVARVRRLVPRCSPPLPICRGPLTSDDLAAPTDRRRTDVDRARRGGPVSADRRTAATSSRGQAVGRAPPARPHPADRRRRWTPDDRGPSTTTVWMDGTFHSQVTQGHVGAGPGAHPAPLATSACSAAHGLRLFVARRRHRRRGDCSGRPSAWCVSPDGCRWWYAADGPPGRGRPRAPRRPPRAPPGGSRVGSGRRCGGLRRCLALGGDDGADRAPPRSRVDGADTSAPGCDRRATDPGATAASTGRRRRAARRSWATLFRRPDDCPGSCCTTTVRRGRDPESALVGDGADRRARAVLGHRRRTLSRDARRRRRRRDRPSSPAGSRVLPWFAHDALVHYLVAARPRAVHRRRLGHPRRLPGPGRPAHALDRQHERCATSLLRVLRAQNARGDWPQAFEFYRRIAEHGPAGLPRRRRLLAAAARRRPPARHRRRDLPRRRGALRRRRRARPRRRRVAEHLDRAWTAIEAARRPRHPLPAYGHGDWNDSLQPADPAAGARRSCSTWTVGPAGAGPRRAGRRPRGARRRRADLAARRPRPPAAGRHATTRSARRAARRRGPARATCSTRRRRRGAEPLVHPRDSRTGLTYGSCPMIHAVDRRRAHPGEARAPPAPRSSKHLLGPDGARLFDRPVGLPRRPDGGVPAGRGEHLLRSRDRHHVHPRAPALRRGAGARRRRRRAAARARPGQPRGARPTGCRGAAAAAHAATTPPPTARSPTATTPPERYADLRRARCRSRAAGGSTPPARASFLRLVVERLLGIRRRGDRRRGRPGAAARGRRAASADRAVRRRAARVRYRVGPEGYGVRRGRRRRRRARPRPLDNPYRQRGRRRAQPTTCARRSTPVPTDPVEALKTTDRRQRPPLARPAPRHRGAGRRAAGRDDPRGQGRPAPPGRQHGPGRGRRDLRAGRHRLEPVRVGRHGRQRARRGRPGRQRSTRSSGSRVERAAGSASRVLFGRDVIHGHRTVVPIPLGLARVLRRPSSPRRRGGRRARPSLDGVAWTFAPMIDISEEPRWGRVAESFGEAPVLARPAGRRAWCAASRARTRATATGSPPAPSTSSATAWSAGGRDYDTVIVGENTLRNLHLRPFRAAVDGRRHDGDGRLQRRRRHPDARPPAPAARRAQGRVGVRRGRRRRLERHRPAGLARASPRTSARPPGWRSRRASTSTCVSGAYREHLADLVRSGEVAEDAGRRRGTPGAADEVPPRPLRRVPTPDGHRPSQRADRRDPCAGPRGGAAVHVLLKNDGVLPLDRTRAGAASPVPSSTRATRCSAPGSSTAAADEVVTPAAAPSRERAPATASTVADGRFRRPRPSASPADRDVTVALVGEHPAAPARTAASPTSACRRASSTCSARSRRSASRSSSSCSPAGRWTSAGARAGRRGRRGVAPRGRGGAGAGRRAAR